METVFGLIESDLAQLFAYIIAVLGFVITIISFLKIGKIRRGQADYKKLINIKGAIELFKNISNFFQALKNNNSISDEQKRQIDALQGDINKNIGSIEAIDRALFSEANTDTQNIGVEYFAEGFYDDDFFKNIIAKANKQVIICCKRNTRPFKQENLDTLINMAQNGVDVQILAISANMNRTLLEEIKKSVPNPPSKIAQLISSQNNNKRQYLDRKNNLEPQKQKNINYYETKEIVWYNFVVTDNYLYWGIVNYQKQLENGLVYKERPYLRYPINNPFAQKVLKIYKDIIQRTTIEKY